MKIILCYLLFCFFAFSQIVVCTTSYKLVTSTAGFKSSNTDDKNIYGAGAYSTFEIVNETDSTYKVMFHKINDYSQVEAKLPMSLLEKKNIITVSKQVFYVITKTDLPKYYYHFSSGDIAGVLAVPFKLINNGKLSPGSTLGGFYGYKISTISILASAGLASIPTSDINSKQVETKFGFTIAGGIVFEPEQKFQLGIIFGIDHLGNDWQYENRGWLSLAIGYSFTQ